MRLTVTHTCGRLHVVFGSPSAVDKYLHGRYTYNRLQTMYCIKKNKNKKKNPLKNRSLRVIVAVVIAVGDAFKLYTIAYNEYEIYSPAIESGGERHGRTEFLEYLSYFRSVPSLIRFGRERAVRQFLLRIFSIKT